MDELQARTRAMRSLPTDANLAKQPYPEFVYPEDDPADDEANIVAMPKRQAQLGNRTEPMPPQRSTAKRQQDAALKRTLVAAKPKAFPFRQMRDGHQQPFIDELKRLEAQAERINQLLAERSRQQTQTPPASGALKGLPRFAKADAPKEITPKKKLARGANQSSRSPQQESSSMSALEDDSTEALKAQAERINQLLRELEAALMQGEAMVAQGELIDRTADSQPHTPRITGTAMPPMLTGVEAFPSHVDRAEIPSFVSAPKQPLPEPEDQKAQQEAVETAQALRYLASRERIESSSRTEPLLTDAVVHEPRRTGVRSRPSPAQFGLPLFRQYGARIRQFLQLPPKRLDQVGDAVLWIVLSAVVRLGARSMLGLFPALAPVFTLLMFAPAMLAVYLAIFAPKAGFVSIYRLFLIMLGLLVGGRL